MKTSPACGGAAQPELATRATPTGNTGLQLPGTAPGNAGQRTGGSGAAAAAEPAVMAQRWQWVTAFWDHARACLYADAAFDEAQHQRALKAVWDGVYAAFGADNTAAEWGSYHRQALERVDLAAAWLRRNPGRYLPAPYAQLVPGRGYFDRANARGFVRTEEWHARKQHNVHTYHLHRTLELAAAHLRGWHTRKAPAWVLALPKRQLYLHYLAKVQAFCDPVAVAKLQQLAAGHA